MWNSDGFLKLEKQKRNSTVAINFTQLGFVKSLVFYLKKKKNKGNWAN